MTKDKNTGKISELVTNASAEIKLCLEGNETKLPEGRIEQLRESVSRAAAAVPESESLTSLLAEFDALYKAYMSRFHYLHQSRGAAEWDNYARKQELCREVEELGKCADRELPRVARDLKLIRLRWNNLGSVPAEKGDNIWKTFCERCGKLQERITGYYHELEENRKSIAVEKNKICETAEQIQSSTDWENTAQVFKGLQKRWREIGFTAPEHETPLYLRFRAACDTFFNARKEYYQQTKSARESVTSIKSQLCEEAKTIFTLSYSEAHQLIPDLWRRWKTAGSAGKNDRELYERFRGYFDTYYDELRRQRSRNLEIKTKLCDDLQVLKEAARSGKRHFRDIKADYLKIRKQWDTTGAMPRAEEAPVLETYAALTAELDTLMFKPKPADKARLKRSFELERIISAALDSLDSRRLDTWEKCRSEWEAMDSVEKKYFRDSFKDISAAFDNASDDYRKQLLDASSDNLEKRRKICAELEQFGIEPEPGATDQDLAEELTLAIASNFGDGSKSGNSEKAEKIDELVERWLEGGIVPLKDLPQLYERFERAVAVAIDSGE
ncbi:MAG: DUF349 domain-containing protein [Victivallaceae bacterium]|nr:DUF349 domain-containing protein [Victivallaceae bacterium]